MLCAKVPWPMRFGGNTKAAAYLKQALALNPGGIDPNFFSSDFLCNQGRYAEAAEYVTQARAVPPRPGLEDSDSGRHLEAQALADALRKRQVGQAIAP